MVSIGHQNFIFIFHYTRFPGKDFSGLQPAEIIKILSGRKIIPCGIRSIPCRIIDILLGMEAIPNRISMIPCCRNPIPFGMIIILYGIEPIPNRISIIPGGSKAILFGIRMIPCGEDILKKHHPTLLQDDDFKISDD